MRAWLAWFVGLNVLWLILISDFVLAETILGLFASAVAATAAEAVREQRLVGFRPRLRWLRKARVLPGRTIRESAEVVTILLRHVTGRGRIRGRFQLVPVSLPDDPDEAAAKRALLTVGESFAPNAYVLGVDDENGVMLVHELVREQRE